MKADNNVYSEIHYDFQININSRKKYEIPLSFFSLRGNIIISNFSEARILAEKINSRRRSEKYTQFVTPGIINAAAILHEVMHFVIQDFEKTEAPGLFANLLNDFINAGKSDSDNLLMDFIRLFPPRDVYTGTLTPEEYLQKKTNEKDNREIILEEILLLQLLNMNPAVSPISELNDDSALRKNSNYTSFLIKSDKYFRSEKRFGKSGGSLLEFLRRPATLYPDNIELQLKFILSGWNLILDKEFSLRLLRGTDLINEDAKLFISHAHGGGVGATPPVPEFKALSAEQMKMLKSGQRGALRFQGIDETSLSYYLESEQFTPDTDWMPNVVMIAKNSFVWLDQLSRKYEMPVRTLSDIPDIELDSLRASNINSLWLIGVWERSPASRKIKQFCGNHDAVSSAYSLFDYEIAVDLGGYAAYENLRNRCSARGIRLASDMVPNHTGIYSKWITEHPDYFIQSPVPPYPNYSFTGPDLSESPYYQIRIEDRYYTRSDAAVVFELKENSTGRTRYIYHGNDGTNMPWNDTAQLNLLLPAVREALIQQIKKVASLFPIIRFDAAMTLAKKHFSRLWFPQPGLGGAVPSRSDYGMTREAFDAQMPNEFWRDVVDRINAEMPETLLLAEAFWLMEGYFVRTLGMHRVYNSAFMHMFMKEENEKYKELIKNTLEFNPEILKRYVNFMSNPDEETAVNQFGKGDKYFGVCVMMLTLPGLPMFAHGQIEGYTEKYGMEYQRAYYNESPDGYLIHRHERDIFPLARLRYLFSEVKNFWLFDFHTSSKQVNQNVFAFTNMKNMEKALVLYNNAYEQAKGYIHFSGVKVKGDAQASEKPEFESRTLTEALSLKSGNNIFYICYETISRQQYLFYSEDMKNEGLKLLLKGYEYRVFLGFQEYIDNSGDFMRLYERLDGAGVDSVETAMVEMKSEKLHFALSELFSANNVKELSEYFLPGLPGILRGERRLSNNLSNKISSVCNEIELLGYSMNDKFAIIRNIESEFISVQNMISELSQNTEVKLYQKNDIRFYFGLITSLNSGAQRDLFSVYLVMEKILESLQLDSKAGYYAVVKNLSLEKELWQIFIRLNNNYHTIKQEYDLLKVLLSESLTGKNRYNLPALDEKQQGNTELRDIRFYRYLNDLLELPEVRYFIGHNIHESIEYFNQENFELLIKWNLILTVLRRHKVSFESSSEPQKQQLLQVSDLAEECQIYAVQAEYMLKLAEISGFRFREFLKLIHAPSEESSIPKVRVPDKAGKKKSVKRIVTRKKKETLPGKKIKDKLGTKKAAQSKSVKPKQNKKKTEEVKKSSNRTKAVKKNSGKPINSTKKKKGNSTKVNKAKEK